MCSVGEASDVWNETRPCARKPYHCDECGGVIGVGVRYARISSLFDGSWDVATVHEECLSLAELLNTDMCGGDGFSVGQMREHLAEAGITHHSHAPVPLSTLARVGDVRKRWHEIRTKHLGWRG